MTGPLAGISVVEFASIGPGPFAAMVLADMGARVVRIERPEACGGPAPRDPLLRGRSASIGLHLKHSDAVEVALRLVERSDVLVEGLRPGVMERLGLGPDACLGRNPRLVYGRMTGWGQDGPRSGEVGHDIGYAALGGALGTIGPADRPPPPPLNLLADFGGGAMMLVSGILAALVARGSSGKGDVVDAAMVEGAALLTAMIHGMRAEGVWSDERDDNLLDGGAPFYRCYATADGRHVAVGALEPQFYRELLAGLELDDGDLPDQYDRAGWPTLRERFEAVFVTRTRDEWAAIFAGTDACVVPVLALGEVAADPHLAARGTFVDLGGTVQPGPAPRFGSSGPTIPAPGRPPGADGADVLADLGYSEDDVAHLRSVGAVS
ncbi:MAG TPA: CaiB/BaiF CoA-transferase family protein [Acidimicrobiia bacterium]|nr:CaiB/BaiF CoA-transferase family protein [Acidimicrobiia bacterium]